MPDTTHPTKRRKRVGSKRPGGKHQLGRREPIPAAPMSGPSSDYRGVARSWRSPVVDLRCALSRRYQTK